MKARFYFTLSLLIVGIFLFPCRQVRAQLTAHDTTNYTVGDTMYVAWEQSDGSPRVNALYVSVVGDTAANGTRADMSRVYVLKANGFYWDSDPIVNTGFPLTIIGQPFDNTESGNWPAILQQTDLRADGTASPGGLITGQNDLTIKNIYISGRTTSSGSQNAYQPCQINASNHKFLIDNCVIEQSNFSIFAWTGTHNIITVTNNKFRNLEESPVTQQWTGRGLSYWADQDTVVMENNTFFNVGFAAFQDENGSTKYLMFNHNTCVNIGRGVTSASGDWWQSAFFANNLIINGWWEGEGTADLTGSGRDSREKYSGLFTIAVLPAAYGPEQERRIAIANNYAYLDPKFITDYAASSVQRAYFIDPVSVLDYVNNYPSHMVIQDTVWLTSLPAGLATYPLTDANWQQPLHSVTGATMADSMWAMITTLRAGVTGGTTFFYHPSVHPSDETWPLPEDFTYTDANLMKDATDGLAVGNLDYFPTQKATFVANQAAYDKQITVIAGKPTIFPVDSVIPAKATTLSGTAAVAANQGLTYFDYNGGGSITWTFNVTTAGQYDTKWYVNEYGRGQSGPVIAFNGTQVHDKSHMWGQFIFDAATGVSGGQPNNAWIWVPITADSVGGFGTWSPGDSAAFTLAAGSNTLAVLSGGWGEMYFAEVDLVVHGGTDTIKLKAPDAVAVNCAGGAVGLKWTATQGFKYVNLGTGGTMTFSVTPPSAGTYHLRVFGQNISGSNQPLTIKEGSTTLDSPVLPFKSDSTGSDVFSNPFQLTAGTHTLAVSGGYANVDYIQLIGEVEGVRQTSPVANSFDLEQNYPNPFNPTTEISYTIPKNGFVTLKVFNILGQEVTTLFAGQQTPGQHFAIFDATKFASGVYFYRLQAGSLNMTKKMMLLK
jgi:hypothetical protein